MIAVRNDEFDECSECEDRTTPAFIRTMKNLRNGSGYPLSDNLKPEEIELKAQVRIVWLLSSDS